MWNQYHIKNNYIRFLKHIPKHEKLQTKVYPYTNFTTIL